MEGGTSNTWMSCSGSIMQYRRRRPQEKMSLHPHSEVPRVCINTHKHGLLYIKRSDFGKNERRPRLVAHLWACHPLSLLRHHDHHPHPHICSFFPPCFAITPKHKYSPHVKQGRKNKRGNFSPNCTHLKVTLSQLWFFTSQFNCWCFKEKNDTESDLNDRRGQRSLMIKIRCLTSTAIALSCKYLHLGQYFWTFHKKTSLSRLAL